jgi:hypothetical protein
MGLSKSIFLMLLMACDLGLANICLDEAALFLAGAQELPTTLENSHPTQQDHQGNADILCPRCLCCRPHAKVQEKIELPIGLPSYHTPEARPRLDQSPPGKPIYHPPQANS